jgi:hypothetical protein
LPRIYLVDRIKNTTEIFDLTLLKKLKPEVNSDELEKKDDPRSKLVLMIEKLIESSEDEKEIIDNNTTPSNEDTEISVDSESEADSGLDKYARRFYMC